MINDKDLIYELEKYIANSESGRCILCKNNMKNITLDGVNNGCDGECYHEILTEEQKVSIISKWFIKGIERKNNESIH